jgi:hypothetical protein
MRNIPRVSLVAVATALLLAGCVPSAPIVTPAPAPSTAPIFASEEDALAAATAAYAAYVKVSDQVFMEGGAHPERLEAVATGEQLKADIAGYKTAAAKNVHSTGGTAFEHVTLQSLNDSSTDGRAVIAVYLCEDVSKVDVIDSSGTSVVSTSRPSRVSYEVKFNSVPANSSHLLVAYKEPWSGGGC